MTEMQPLPSLESLLPLHTWSSFEQVIVTQFLQLYLVISERLVRILWILWMV